MNALILGGLALAGVAAYQRIDRDVIQPVTAQLWVEERDAPRGKKLGLYVPAE